MAGDDLRPLQADATCADRGATTCICADIAWLAAEVEHDYYAESYLVDEYAEWDSWAGAAW